MVTAAAIVTAAAAAAAVAVAVVAASAVAVAVVAASAVAVAVVAASAAAAVVVAASAAATMAICLRKIVADVKRAIVVTRRTTTKIDALGGLDLLFQCLAHHSTKPFVRPLCEVQTIGQKHVLTGGPVVGFKHLIEVDVGPPVLRFAIRRHQLIRLIYHRPAVLFFG